MQTKILIANSNDSNSDSNKLGLDIHLDVRLIECDDPQHPSLEYGYNPALNEWRNKIDSINPEDWKKARWYINEYDFFVKDPIINRAFYKYWETINEFRLFERFQEKDYVLHCAEAPGGFIQGTNIFLQAQKSKVEKLKPCIDEEGFTSVKAKKRKQKVDQTVYTISLNKDLPQYKSYNLPSYNKSISTKNVCITYGKDSTGDINNWENIIYIKEKAKNDFFLITADGGFDEGTDFNNKEQLHYGLILSEIYSAIELQKVGGHFILKVFDVFTDTSVHLLYLLSLCYSEVFTYKPSTSRPTNSEKYIICKGFKLSQTARKYTTDALTKLSTYLKVSDTRYVSFTLFKSIPKNFCEKIKHMNELLLQKQCDFLEKAVDLCNNALFLANYDKNLLESIGNREKMFERWEKQYNLDLFI